MTRKTETPFWLRLLNRIAAADYRYRQAAHLHGLSDHMLDDMGITRAEADRAFVSSPFDRPADRAPMPLTRGA